MNNWQFTLPESRLRPWPARKLLTLIAPQPRQRYSSEPPRQTQEAHMTVEFEGFVQEHRIAYFSMEFALNEQTPTYSGGLGVLAGDTMRTASDLDLPMVGVTLVSRAGYFRQEIIDGAQVENPDAWQPEKW